MARTSVNQDHSSVWLFQTWASFVLSIMATSVGILNLPVDSWMKGYMGMGMLFTVGSTVTLCKTQRDIHEGKKITSKIEDAKVEKLLSEHL